MSILFCIFVVEIRDITTNPQDPEGQAIMKYKVTLTLDEVIRAKLAVENDIKRKWQEQIEMAQRGYGKLYWAEEIDELADILMKLRERIYL